MKIPQASRLRCPRCQSPFKERGLGHEPGCGITGNYLLPQEVRGGYQLVIFGSRKVPVEMVAEILGFLNGVLSLHPDLSLVTGGARGVDSLADTWAEDHQVAVERWPPQYELFGRYIAPLWRNAEMAARYPDAGAAFIGPCEKQGCRTGGLHGSHGSVDMALRLRDRSITVFPHVWGGLDLLANYLMRP